MENKKRILYLTNLPSPYRRDFFELLGKKCELTVIYEKSSSLDRDSNWVSEVNSKGVFNEIYLDSEAMINRCSPWKLLKSFIIKKEYNYIILGMYSTLLSLKSIFFLKHKKIPYYISSDGGFIKKDNFIKKFIKKYAFGSAKKIFCVSEENAKYLIHYGAKRENLIFYHFTSLYRKDIIDTILSEKQKKEVKNELGIKEEKVILYVGQFIERKGIDLLIDACQNINDVGIYLIGKQNNNNEYAKKIRDKYKSNIHEISFLKKEELVKYYCSADLFILPTREDVWGLVVNEAMARGLPVITTNKCLAGLALVDRTNGLICKANSVEDLNHGIKWILQQNLNEMSENSLKKIRDYNYEQMVLDYLNALK